MQEIIAKLTAKDDIAIHVSTTFSAIIPQEWALVYEAQVARTLFSWYAIHKKGSATHEYLRNRNHHQTASGKPEHDPGVAG